VRHVDVSKRHISVQVNRPLVKPVEIQLALPKSAPSQAYPGSMVPFPQVSGMEFTSDVESSSTRASDGLWSSPASLGLPPVSIFCCKEVSLQILVPAPAPN
jgi:hypothetical protein